MPVRTQLFVVALGSNIEPRVHLPRALARMKELLTVTAVSHVYETVPVGDDGEALGEAPGEAVGEALGPFFLNAAVRGETRRSPGELKWQVLRPLEAELGRVRTEDKNAPRTLDLDLVLYGRLVLRDPEQGLTLPDPELLTRAHLALPVAEVAGELVHPETHRPLAELGSRFLDEPGIRTLDRSVIPAWYAA